MVEMLMVLAACFIWLCDIGAGSCDLVTGCWIGWWLLSSSDLGSLMGVGVIYRRSRMKGVAVLCSFPR